MQQHPVVTQEEWLTARKALLAKEKEATHLRDKVNAERLALPWVKVEKTYVFDTPKGKRTLAELFADAASSSSITSCSARAGPQAAPAARSSPITSMARLPHLEHHDVTWWPSLPRAARGNRSVSRSAWAGNFTGIRPSAATSISTTTFPSRKNN